MCASAPDGRRGSGDRAPGAPLLNVQPRSLDGGSPSRASARRWVGVTCAAACVFVGACFALVFALRASKQPIVHVATDSQPGEDPRRSPPPVFAPSGETGAGTLGAPPPEEDARRFAQRRALADAVSSASVSTVRRLVDRLSCEDDFSDLVRAVWSPGLEDEIVVVLLYGLAQWSNDDRAATACRLAPDAFRPGTITRGRSDRRIDDVLDKIAADLLGRKELGEVVANALLQVSAARVGLESRAVQEYTGPGQTELRATLFLDALLVRPLEPSLLPVVTEMSRSGRHKLRERAWRVLVTWDARAVEQVIESPQDQSAPLLDECTRLSALFGRGEADCWSAPPETLSRASARFCSALARIDLDSPASLTSEATASAERALRAIASAYSTRRADVGAAVAESVVALLATGALVANEGAAAELAFGFPTSDDWFPELFASPTLDRCPTPVLGLIARVASRLSTDDSARQRQAARLEGILDRREVSREERNQVVAPYR